MNFPTRNMYGVVTFIATAYNVVLRFTVVSHMELSVIIPTTPLALIGSDIISVKNSSNHVSGLGEGASLAGESLRGKYHVQESLNVSCDFSRH